MEWPGRGVAGGGESRYFLVNRKSRENIYIDFIDMLNWLWRKSILHPILLATYLE